MNENELNNLLADFFSKSALQPSNPKDSFDPYKRTNNIPDCVALTFASHAFVRDAKKLIEEHLDKKTDLDVERLYFLVDKAKSCLDMVLPGMSKYMPNKK